MEHSNKVTRKWWKEGVMYQIYPRSFQDSNGDGIGDLNGIMSRIPYLKELGVDIIWLGPVYESPNDDNGYDISDYRKIHPEFGTMEDFRTLLRMLHDHGIKLIMDLVVNHTSDEHYWFKESRKSKDNPYRDYYFWKEGKNDGPPNNWVSFFKGSAWEKDEKTGEFYLHLFTKKQPDLNWENPNVRKEVYDIMRFWLDEGVDGFRMDVISLISKRLEFKDGPIEDFTKLISETYANGPRIHEYLQEMYEEVLSKYDVMTVGEGPGITKEVALDYIGADRNELNMIFQLELMFLDFGAEGRAEYREFAPKEIKQVMMDWEKAIGDKGWNNIFLDNHDFARVLSRFGNDKALRVESAKCFLTLLLTFKGTPCIYQGTEIGMTNVVIDEISELRDVEAFNIYREYVDSGRMTEHDFIALMNKIGRDNVRTPMQWSDEPYAGFSTHLPWININDNYESINVSRDQMSENSIFQFTSQLIDFRRNNLDLIYGKLVELEPEHDKLFIYKRSGDKKTYLIILNLSNDFIIYPKKEWMNSLSLHFCNYDSFAFNLNDKQVKFRPWEALVFEQL